MRRYAFLKKILFVAAMSVFFIVGLGACPKFTAFADEQETLSLTKDDFSFFLPANYEQYLSLSEVKSVAVKDNYIAVADGNNIYIYDGIRYRAYNHEGSEIIQCDFGYDGNLWLLDKDGLYSLDCSAETLAAKLISAKRYSSFTVTDTGAFGSFANSDLTTIYAITFDGEQSEDSQIFTITTNIVPRMSYENDTLYCAYGGNLMAYTTSIIQTYKDAFPSDVTDMTVENGVIRCVNAEGLYEVILNPYETSADVTLLSRPENGTFTFLAQSGSYLYVTEQADVARIRRYDLNDDIFTSYEIGSSSAADNRLQNATNSATCGNKLFVADVNRILIYDGEKKTYTAFPVDFTPDYLASNGKTVLAAKDRQYAFFSLDGVPMSEVLETSNPVTGIACGWGGDYYISCAPQTFLCISADDLSEKFRTSLTFANSVESFTADVFGKLYIKDTTGKVYCYTEQELQTGVQKEEVYAELPATSRHLNADMWGGVYTADSQTLYYSDGESAKSYELQVEDKFFGAKTSLVSFALNGMDGTVYFVYGDYILQSVALPVPNLSRLSAAGAYTTIYNAESETTVAEILPGTLCISFDVGKLQAESEYFSGCNYVRYAETTRAVILTEIQTDENTFLIAAPIGSTVLVLIPFPEDNCLALDRSEYLKDADFTDNTGYLTNNVSLYKYPYLISELTYGVLEKGTQLTVNGRFVTGEGIEFLYVVCNGQKGYIPAGYVSNIYGQKTDYTIIRYETLHCDYTVTAYAGNGDSVELLAGVDYMVGLCGEADGKVIICYVAEDGTLYYATIPVGDITEKENSMLRIFFGIILLIADLLIIVNYTYYRRYDI